MRGTPSALSALLLLGALQGAWVVASDDGLYRVEEVAAAWDGTDADRLARPNAEDDYTYGDEASLTYVLPWPFAFYGSVYDRIHVDTNGNIWFGATGSANSFDLSATGRGPVIAAWNDDLSSHYVGGVFVQHKLDPERVVIEWQAENYREEAYLFLNNFEVVLFPDGTARVDYKSFGTENGKDAGSGISSGTTALSLTAAYGKVFTLAGRSFVFAATQRHTARR